MPEISPLGWFHTGIAIIALVCGVYSLVKFKLIARAQPTGLVYLVCTFVAAVTALGIYQHGGFGPAHGLAVLTLVGLAVGAIGEQTRLFGGLSPYAHVSGYSFTFLCHMIPAITDGLMRLPVGDPVVTNPEDPLLRGFYLLFLVLFVVGLGAQVVMLRNRGRGVAEGSPA